MYLHPGCCVPPGVAQCLQFVRRRPIMPGPQVAEAAPKLRRAVFRCFAGVSKCVRLIIFARASHNVGLARCGPWSCLIMITQASHNVVIATCGRVVQFDVRCA